MTTGTVKEERLVRGGRGEPASPYQPPTTGGFSVSDRASKRFRKHIPQYPPSPDLCWEWTGCLSGNGYGSFWDGTKRVNAHRFSYLIFTGAIPEGLLVLHRCDNRKCVNPYHLFLGTYKDNSQDCKNKGRLKINRRMFQKGVAKPEVSGEKNGRSKLKESDLQIIHSLRKSGKLFREIAEHLGVSKTCVYLAFRGINWKNHYTEPDGLST